MVDGAHLELVKSLQLGRQMSDFTEILHNGRYEGVRVERPFGINHRLKRPTRLFIWTAELPSFTQTPLPRKPRLFVIQSNFRGSRKQYLVSAVSVN